MGGWTDGWMDGWKDVSVDGIAVHRYSRVVDCLVSAGWPGDSIERSKVRGAYTLRTRFSGPLMAVDP